MGLKGQSHRGANGRDSGRQTEKKGDERRGKRRQWECMFHSRNKRLYELTTIFEERARAHKSERRRFTRGHRTMSCLSILSHPFSKMKSFQREKTTPLSRFVPFRTGFVQVSYRICTSCNSFSIQIWQLFLWHLVPSIWIISNSGIIYFSFS